MVIADLSVVLAWYFEEDQTPAALDVLQKIEIEGLLVPPLWWSELANGLLMGERRGRRTTDESRGFLKLIRALPITVDHVSPGEIGDHILTVARQFQLTAYDATYVELAVRTKSSLATFDAAIRSCAPLSGIQLLPAVI